METLIFAVGLVVSILVIFGIFSQIPSSMRPPDEVVYRSAGDD